MIFARLKRLWELSGQEIKRNSIKSPRLVGAEITQSSIEGKKMKDAQFFARIKEKPIDKITKIANENAN